VPITVVRRIICSTLRRGLPPRVEFFERQYTSVGYIGDRNQDYCAKPAEPLHLRETRTPKLLSANAITVTELIDFWYR